jgi:adenylosuccinate synthase
VKNVRKESKMNGLVVGLQYGDEGKGRVSAWAMPSYDWNVRFNGGPNAGHTVYHDGTKYALHHLPAGSVMGKKIALDAGMVINFSKLREECKKVGIKISDLHISESAHLISEKHLELDSNGSGVGSTKRGIAYAYSDKALRKGLRFKDYESFDMINTYRGLPPIADNESALYESAQGVMIDVNYGHYPYVTSSSVFPSVIHNIDERIGVMKAYTSRVGDGPPNYRQVKELTVAGDEYGTTTGRPRRCTWLIVDEVKYAISLLGEDSSVVVTKLDILKDMDISVWDGGELRYIGGLDNYKNFLIETFPQITHFSESPKGDLIEV